MRVLLIAENWPPRVGGIENYLTNIARHLPAGSVRVIAPKAVRGSEVSDPAAPALTVQRRRLFWPLVKPAWLPTYISIYRSAKRQPPHLVLCGKALFEGLIGYYLKQYLGIPYIVFTYASEIGEWATRPRTRRQLTRVLTAANRVVYINDETKKMLLDLGVKGNQLIKIWPGVASQYFSTPEQSRHEAIAATYKLRTPYILTVTRLIPRKGVDLLIEAFASLDQTKYGHVQLVIAGTGPEEERLQQLAKQNYMGRSINFLGHVPDSDLPALYTDAYLFALTPRTIKHDIEGFGIVYLEAAAAGVPALATRGGGTSEAVIHNQTGVLVQPTAAAIRDGLEHFLDRPKERNRLAVAARQRAYNEFRWPKRILLAKGMIDAVLSEKLHKTRKNKETKE